MVSCFFTVPAYATETITVAVASSLYPAMQKQAESFEKKHDVSIRLVSGSTGRLYNQIVQGAPFDAFIAADEQRPALLAGQGRVKQQYDLEQGYLGVMLAHQVIADPDALMQASIRHIAIANPDVAPFGAVSKAVLQQRGLWQALQHKFVYAQNAMQASMMVNKGLVDAGLVALSSPLHAIAVIHYRAVVLSDKVMAREWLSSMADESKTLSLLSRKP